MFSYIYPASPQNPLSSSSPPLSTLVQSIKLLARHEGTLGEGGFHCTMRFRQWRIGIRVFGTFALILWVLRSFQVKMLLSLSNSLPFAWISLVKLGKNSKNSYFSDFEPIFLLFGGVCSKRDFSKKKFFLREGFFETNLDLNKHPQQVF